MNATIKKNKYIITLHAFHRCMKCLATSLAAFPKKKHNFIIIHFTGDMQHLEIIQNVKMNCTNYSACNIVPRHSWNRSAIHKICLTTERKINIFQL